MADQQQDVLEALSSEHRGIERAWSLAETDDRSVEADQRLGELDREELVAMVVRHFVAEEQYLLPLVRRELSDGDALADDGFAQNRTCENALRLLEDDKLDPSQLEEAMDQARRILADHIRVQERTLFPALAQKVGRDELVALTDDVLGVEQIAPDRPRRVASDSPAVSKAETLVQGFVDHVRDALTRYGQR